MFGHKPIVDDKPVGAQIIKSVFDREENILAQ